AGARLRPAAPVVVATLEAHGDLAPLHRAATQRRHHVARAVLGHLGEREAVGDHDGADLLAGDPGLAGDGADHVLRPQPHRASGADEDARHAARHAVVARAIFVRALGARRARSLALRTPVTRSIRSLALVTRLARRAPGKGGDVL